MMSDKNMTEETNPMSQGNMTEETYQISHEKMTEETNQMSEGNMAEETNPMPHGTVTEKTNQIRHESMTVETSQVYHKSLAEEPLSGSFEKFSETEIFGAKMHTEKQTYFHLLGKTGSGRSATGNTILGRKSFSTKSSFSAVTTSIQMESPEGRPDIIVVDGPGLVGVNTGLSDESVKAFRQVVVDNQNAEHVFLVICRYGERFTEEDEEMMTRLKKEFGGQRALENHAIVVLTCGDNFERDTEDEDLTFEEWCKQQTGAFKDLRKWCMNRILAVDNFQKRGIRGKPFLCEVEELVLNIKMTRGNDKLEGKCLIQYDEEREKSLQRERKKYEGTSSPDHEAVGHASACCEKVSEMEVFEAKSSETKMRTEKQTYFHILGKTGSGRSATGNTILGRKSFSTKSSFSAVTTSIQMESPEGRPDIVVVDGPGLVGVNTGLSDESVKAFRQVVVDNQNADHVFLVICRYGERFTEEEEEMVTRLKKEFGGQRALENHAIVVLTCGDNFERDTEDEDLTFEEWCKQQTGAFKDLRKWCMNRILAVDNFQKRGIRGKPFLCEVEELVLNIKVTRGNDKLEGKCLIQYDEEREKSLQPERKKYEGTSSPDHEAVGHASACCEKVSEMEVFEAKSSETKMRTEKQTYFHILGKTGSGRSATGNTILGRKSFSTKSSFSAVTTSIQMESPEGRPDIVVVDGPGLVGVNTGLSDESVKAFRQVVVDNQNADHVFLVICRYGERFTEEEEEMVTRLKKEFGGQRALENHAIVVLTCGDNFERDTEDEDLTFEEWCKQQTGAFKNLRKWCKNRVISVDNIKRQGLGGTSFLSLLEEETQKMKTTFENKKRKRNDVDYEEKRDKTSAFCYVDKRKERGILNNLCGIL